MKSQFKGIIYKATCLINRKCYIGKTNNLKERIIYHKKCSKSKNKKFKNILFYKAIRKYGFDNFKWEILKECDTLEILNLLETFMIMVHHSHISEGGYNMTWGGDGGDIFTYNPKKEQIREKHRQNLMGNRYWLGKHHTEKTKQKMSIKHKGLKKGIKLTEEHKKKIGLAFKGKKLSEEHKKKIRLSNIGKHYKRIDLFTN